jgi:hypothetical protein
MQEFCVRGVVRGGQIVLEMPLDLPDGTVVTVSELVRSPSEADKTKMLTLLSRLDLLDDPDWRKKVEPDRVAHLEKLTLEAVETGTDSRPSASERARPHGLAPSEEWKRNLLTAVGRPDLFDDPDWWEKSETARLAHIQELIRDAAELRAKRSAGSAPSAGPERP